MHHDLTKVCADTLRVFLRDQYGVKLRSGHAHEITATIFGYKSRIALLADKDYPVSRLAAAELIVLEPPIGGLERRLKSLEGLPASLPPGSILAESIYAVIKDDETLSKGIWHSLRAFVLSLAQDRIYEKLRMLGMDPKTINWIIDIGIQESVSNIEASVSFDFIGEGGRRLRYGKVNILLDRIAGNIGFGNAKVLPTFYSGEFTDPGYDLVHNTQSDVLL